MVLSRVGGIKYTAASHIYLFNVNIALLSQDWILMDIYIVNLWIYYQHDKHQRTPQKTGAAPGGAPSSQANEYRRE